MDIDKVVSVAVDLDGLNAVDNGEKGSAPLVQLSWKNQTSATSRTSHFIISQMDKRGHWSSMCRQHVQQLLYDDVAVYKFAMRMYEQCQLKLQRINHSPIALVFQHDPETNLQSKQQNIFDLLSSFLKEFSHSKTKIIYRINIESKKDDIGEELAKKRMNENEKQQLMTEVQNRFQDANRKLDDQEKLIDSKLSDQEHRIDAMLENVSERFKEVLENDVSTSAVEQADPDLTREQPQQLDIEDTNDGVVLKKSENKNDMQKGEQSCSQEPNDTLIKVSMHGRHYASDNEGISTPLLSEDQKDERELMVNNHARYCGPEDRPAANEEEEPVNDDLHGPHADPQYQLSLGQATEVPSCQSHECNNEFLKGLDEGFPDTFDDLYNEEASYLDSSYVSSPDKFRRGLGHLQSEHKSAPKKVFRILAFVYPPASTDGTSKGLTYPSGIDISAQTESFNFEEEQEAKEDLGTKRRKEMTWNSPDGRDNLRSWLLGVIGDSPNWTRLSASMEEALVQALGLIWESLADMGYDASSVPRTEEGMDTVLCLDTSGSMAGAPLEQMKKTVLNFIEGIETMAKMHNIHENIALVTFGGRARVIQHLTNDYTRLRQSVNALTASGPGPLHEAIVVSLACLQYSGLFYLDSKFKLPPRLVIMCDGYPTTELPETDTDSGYISKHDENHLFNALYELSDRQLSCAMPYPIVFIQIGCKPKMDILKGISSACGGSVTSADSFSDMSKFQRINMIAAKALMYFRNNGAKETIQNMDHNEFISKIAPDITTNEAVQVFGVIYEHFHDLAFLDKGSILSFNNIREESELPPLGSRVVRGQDWKWTNQDAEGTGTVINHSSNKLVYVCWDHGSINMYRYGQDGKYDVVLVENQPKECNCQYPCIGRQVERGPHWRAIYGDQDGGHGQYGVIIRKDVEGRILVRWNNGNIFGYRCYSYYKYDVILRDPLAVVKETTARAAVPVLNKAQEMIPDTEDQTWQREDREKGWETYSEEETLKLNKAYLRNPFGSCLLRRNGESFRVSFTALEERSMEKTKVKVRRQPCK